MIWARQWGVNPEVDSEIAGDAGDEALMVAIQAELAAAVDEAIEPWVLSTLARFAFDPMSDAITVAKACRDDVGDQLRRLFATPVAQQATTPLAILRSAGRFPTAALAAAGIPPVPRDPFELRQQPEDIYGVAAATWADFGPGVAEAGLRWGAAKAHLHLRARARLERDAGPERDSSQ